MIGRGEQGENNSIILSIFDLFWILWIFIFDLIYFKIWISGFPDICKNLQIICSKKKRIYRYLWITDIYAYLIKYFSVQVNLEKYTSL